MPELPEVEVVRRSLAAQLSGLWVSQVEAAPFARFSPARAALGWQVKSVSRRGKYLLFGLEGPVADAPSPLPQRLGEAASTVEMVVHLGMTGQLLWFSDVSRVPRVADGSHVQAVWWFSRRVGCRLSGPVGVLVLRDVRRFGRVFVTSPGVYPASSTLARLGPDPLAVPFDRATAVARLQSASGPVKGVLLSQRVVAGVGNYLADEALFSARVHPQASRLGSRVAGRVVDAVCATVAESLAFGGMSMRDYVHVDGASGRFAGQLRVYGRGGLPCVVCGAELASVKVAGRTSTFCPVCQRLPRRSRR